MTAREKLRQRLARTPDEDLAKLEVLMGDALPPEFRASRTKRLTEAVQTGRRLVAWEIEDLTEGEAQEINEYLEWAEAETDTVSVDELEEALKGEAEIARGDYVTLDELGRKFGL